MGESEQCRIVASAPGKAVLLGEYAVLEGAPALVAAINRRARVEVIDAPRAALTSAALQLEEARFCCSADGVMQFADPEIESMPALGMVRAVFQEVAAALARQGTCLRPVRVRIDTAAFTSASGIKLGLGASAAVSVALLQALLVHHQASEAILPKDPEPRCRALMATAGAAHARAQGGIGSGVDIAASVHGGVLRFQRAAGGLRVTPLAPMSELRAAFTWAGHATSTPEFVQRVQALKLRDSARHAALMQHLHAVAQAGIEAWSNGRAADFLAAVATSFSGLYELGRCSGADIVSAAHRSMGRVVAGAGGVYKSSGAGGGDLGVAFAADAQACKQVVEALAAADFSVLPLAFDTRGVHIDTCTSSHGNSP